MKNIFASLLFAALSLSAVSQLQYNIQVEIPGYKQNDTIDLVDLLNMEYIFQCNEKFPITGFVLVYNYGNYDYMMISKSNNLTDDMKNRLTRFESMKVKILKISFKAITVETNLKEQIKTTRQLKYILRIY